MTNGKQVFSCIRHRAIKVTRKASDETRMKAKGGY